MANCHLPAKEISDDGFWQEVSNISVIHIDKKNFNIFIISSLNEYLQKCYKKPVFSRGMNNAVPIARTTLFIYREQYCSYTMKSTVHAIGKDQIIF